MTHSTPVPAAYQNTAVSADGTPIGYRTLGSGPGLIVVGGALRTAEDYLPLASALAESCTVHVVDRRGRGASGPQGPRYSLQTEVEDLLAIHTETGARWAFGHSYGGLVVLETARTTLTLERIVVYEPGVPCAPVPTDWMDPYRERLDAGDPRGAFAHFIRGSGGAPPVVAKLPHWYLRTAMRVGLRGSAWRRIRPLLEANLAEHEQLAARQGRLDDYRAVETRTLVLCGGKSPAASRSEFTMLQRTLPHAVLESLPGLNHFGPEGKTAARVGRATLAFLRTSQPNTTWR
jgi:pimeloyl-ACP methyl ester carboxylesterase